MRKFLSILLVFLALYILLFPRAMLGELTFSANWVQDVSLRSSGVSSAGEQSTVQHPFVLGDLFGYIDVDGNLSLADKIVYGIAIGPRGFFNYSRVPGHLVFQTPDGRVSETMEVRSYPVFMDERLFFVSTNRAGLAEWDLNGSLIWELEFTSLITCMDSNEENLLVGLIDGRIIIIGKEGNILFQKDFPGSRINAVYGGSLSAKGFAVVHGLDPQIVTIFQVENETFSVQLEVPLKENFRRARLSRFLYNGTYIMIEGQNRLILIDALDGTIFDTDLAGTIESFTEIPGLEVVCVLSRDGDFSEIVFLSAPDIELNRVNFTAADTFLDSSEMYLLTGADQFLMRTDLKIQ